MIQYVFYALIALGLVLTFTGVAVKPRIFWLAGIVMYIASYMAGFSTGKLMLAAPVMLWALALAGLSRQLTKPRDYAVWLGIGLLVWVIVYFGLDDRSLFYPFAWMSEHFDDWLRQALRQGD